MDSSIVPFNVGGLASFNIGTTTHHVECTIFISHQCKGDARSDDHYHRGMYRYVVSSITSKLLFSTGSQYLVPGTTTRFFYSFLRLQVPGSYQEQSKMSVRYQVGGTW